MLLSKLSEDVKSRRHLSIPQNERFFIVWAFSTELESLLYDWLIIWSFCLLLNYNRLPCTLTCLLNCFHFKVWMSLCRNPVRIENKNARFKTSSLQGVSTNICTSFILSATRGFSMFVIPFTFAPISTVRYSSTNACFNPALSIEK